MTSAAEAPKAAAVPSTDSPEKTCPTCGASYPADYALCPRDATPLARKGGDGDPLIGQILGDTYEVTKILGEGGMGKVYEARHVRLGRRFAIKMLHAHFLTDAESVARFRREATAAAAIDSPYVAQVVDVHATRDGRPFIVSELLEGEELAAILKRESKVSIARAAAITRQVARGLAVAHAAGVVHRDLKPENVMMCKSPEGGELAKVVDFGIAKSVTDSSLTRTGVVLGTPAYMAPEQARSSAGLDHRVDIYSLGAMLYRMVTGAPAFGGDDPSTTLTAVLYDEPARPKTLRGDLPDALELVIQRAMAKVPDARYASMRELEAALAPFDTGVSDATESPAPSVSGTVPVGGDVGRAATVALSGGAAQLAAAYSEGARARSARPRAVFFAVASIAWILLSVAGLVGSVVHASSHRALVPLESVLAGILAFVVALPVIVLYARDLLRGAWRNTAGMLARAEMLGRVLSVSIASYALVSIGERVVDAVILRQAAYSPWWTVVALVASLASLGGYGAVAARSLGRG